MRRWSVPMCTILLMAAAVPLARACDRPPRLWILPFDNPRADASVVYLEEAIPALLAAAVSHSDRHAVVDRRYLNQVLAEQSLTLEGLTAPHARVEAGRLLGATVMISGSVVKEGEDLRISMRASDLETGIVTAAAEARGPAGRLGRLVSDLYRRVGRDLGKRLPELHADQIDDAPVSNLHFMRGLGYYYSARYNQALAEFMQATQEQPLVDISRLWLANAYLAQEQYDLAYLELSRLRLCCSRNFRKSEIEAKMRACEKHLSAEEMKSIRKLAALQGSAKK